MLVICRIHFTCSVYVTENSTIVMVVGGIYANNNKNDVELFDMNNPGRSCRKPYDYPGATYGSVGVFVDEMAIVCGGYRSSAIYYSDCYTYNPIDATWSKTPFSLTTERYFATSASVQGNWWITGGMQDDALSSTEILLNDTFGQYIDLPDAKERHNLVAIDDRNMTVLLGGAIPDRRTFLFQINNETWTNGPRMSKARTGSQAWTTEALDRTVIHKTFNLCCYSKT